MLPFVFCLFSDCNARSSGISDTQFTERRSSESYDSHDHDSPVRRRIGCGCVAVLSLHWSDESGSGVSSASTCLTDLLL
jgi:hypothetical protein